MLEILISGNRIDLPADISFDLVIENPFMLQDRIPSPFSLTFSLPRTQKNLALFKYPNRIASVINDNEISNVSILIDGLGITSGVLKLDLFDGEAISVYYLGSAFIPNPGTLMFNVEMEKEELDYCVSKDEVLDESGFYGSLKELLSDALDGSKNFVCAPVRVVNDQQFEGVVWPAGVYTYTQWVRYRQFAYDARKMAAIAYVNYWNPHKSKYRYDNWHMPNIAFPKVSYLFDVIFKNLISNNLFDTGDLAKLVMVNHFNPAMINFSYLENYYGCVMDNYLGNNVPFFRLNSYGPGFEIGQYLKDMLKMGCISLFSKKEGGYEMEFNKNILNSTAADDWTYLVAGNLSVQIRKGQSYGYGYNSVKEEKADNPVYQLHHKDMYNIPISSLPLTCVVTSTGEVYKISLPEPTNDVKLPPNTNNLVVGRYYKAVDDQIKYNGNDWHPVGYIFQCVAGQLSYAAAAGRVVDVSPDLWDFECINQGMGVSKDGDYSMSSEVSPLPMGIDKYWWNDPDCLHEDGVINQPVAHWGEWFVPVTDEPRLERPTAAHIGLYHGLRKAFNNSEQYPYVSSHNYDTQGNKIGNLSLSWDAPDGLLATFHQEFKQWIEKDKKAVTAYLRLDALTLKNLDFKRKKNIQGVNFFVEKISVSIKKNRIELAQVDFLEA